MKSVVKPIRCIFVGDLALGDHPKSVGFGFYSKYQSGIPSEKASALFPSGYGHDLVFGNLEFTLGDSVRTGKSYAELNCRGIAGYADFLQQAGFTVLNIANNHIYQHGFDPFEKTLKLLHEKGIGTVGLMGNGKCSTAVQAAGQSLCFLGWSARPRQGFTEAPPYCEFDETSSCEKIMEARKKHSFVIASLHWGDEFIEIPSPEEKRIARKMIDAGANVVIGHHPHVMREVEEYNGGLIAYSLGNFICDMTWNEKTRKTGYLYVELSDNTIKNWELVHGRIDDGYFPDFADTRPDPSSTYKDLYARLGASSYDRMARLSLRRHQALTVMHMLRNMWNYRPGTWQSMLREAITSRININR
jgi:gamma-polyglutamate biosynthesis protein CapA